MDNLTPLVAADGEYSTYVFAQKAVSIIEAQAAAGPSAPPLFLYLAFQNIHWPLEVPRGDDAAAEENDGVRSLRSPTCRYAGSSVLRGSLCGKD